ncbi:MAG TPA: outer membrane beta-barrel protein [Turneriella sp.]|nr:outer membrane beta-barrel protein [Turneriella sp.]
MVAPKKNFSGDNMKKLIGIFAAIALVGAVSAAPKKAPAKPAPKAAAPAPAAVAPAPAAVAPTAKSASNGIGLFVELRGGYILSNGSSTSQADGDTTGTKTYKLSNAGGIAGGLTIGYAISKNLGLAASFDYRNASSRTWEQKAATSTSKIQNVKNTMVVGLGLRPSVEAWGGTVYAGAGAALVLPYSDTTTIDITGAGATAGSTAKVEVKNEWNLGIGVYGELGYNYNITDNLYLGVGVRALVITSNNDGKKQTVTHTTSGGFGPALAGGSGFAAGETEYSTSSAGGKAAYKSDGTTDIGFNINVGFRF